MFATLLKSGAEITHLSHNLTKEEAADEAIELNAEGMLVFWFKQSKGHEHLDAAFCPDCILDAEREGLR